MAATTEEKFAAAVKVVQSLPKNGSFQPSQEMMLRFYAFYKQGNLGPVNIPKPSFWDIVGRAKWDAWSKLTNMPQEEAMLAYIDELKQIIEAMPHTDTVSNFIETLGSFYEIVEDNTKSKKNNALQNALRKGQERKTDMSDEALLSQLNGILSHSDESGFDTEDEVNEHNKSDEAFESKSMLESFSIESGVETLEFKPSISPTDDENINSSEMINSIQNITDIRHQTETDLDNDVFCETSEIPVASSPSMYSASFKSNEGTPYNEEAYPCFDDNEDSNSDSVFLQNSTNETLHNSVETFQSAFKPIKSRLVSEYSGLNPAISSDCDEIIPNSCQNIPLSKVNISKYTYPKKVNKMPNNQYEISYGSNEATNSLLHIDGSTSRDSPRYNHSNQHQERRQRTSREYSRDQNNALLPHNYGNISSGSGAGGNGGGSHNSNYHLVSNNELSDHISVALLRLQQDMTNVLNRLNSIEALALYHNQIARSRQSSESDKGLSRHPPWWWPFPNIPGHTVFAILSWPFIVFYILQIVRRRRNRLR